MKKAIFTVVLTVSMITGLVVWFIMPDVEFNTKEILMVLGLVLVAGFALFLAFRKLRDAKANLPTEDEMSKNIMRRGAATSYYLSLYLWLAIMMLEDKIDLDMGTLIGAGIVGMAIIFALSWIYHRYIRTAHD